MYDTMLLKVVGKKGANLHWAKGTLFRYFVLFVRERQKELYTIDPWTMWELGVKPLCIWELHIAFDSPTT